MDIIYGRQCRHFPRKNAICIVTLNFTIWWRSWWLLIQKATHFWPFKTKVIQCMLREKFSFRTIAKWFRDGTKFMPSRNWTATNECLFKYCDLILLIVLVKSFFRTKCKRNSPRVSILPRVFTARKSSMKKAPQFFHLCCFRSLRLSCDPRHRPDC